MENFKVTNLSRIARRDLGLPLVNDASLVFFLSVLLGACGCEDLRVSRFRINYPAASSIRLLERTIVEVKHTTQEAGAKL